MNVEQRLRDRAHDVAEFSRREAARKTQRNRDSGDVDALYQGLSREQTLEWQAADEISTAHSESALLRDENAILKRELADVRARMERTERALNTIATFVRESSAIPATHARIIENECNRVLNARAALTQEDVTG